MSPVAIILEKNTQLLLPCTGSIPISGSIGIREGDDLMDECGYCGGSLHSKTLPYYDLVWEEETYRFENVAALVCAACDEVFFEASVDQAMDKALEHLDKPKRFAQIPILELPV